MSGNGLCDCGHHPMSCCCATKRMSSPILRDGFVPAVENLTEAMERMEVDHNLELNVMLDVLRAHQTLIGYTRMAVESAINEIRTTVFPSEAIDKLMNARARELEASLVVVNKFSEYWTGLRPNY